MGFPKVEIDKGRTVPDFEMPRADAGHGGCVKCECVSDDVVEGADSSIPTDWGVGLRLTYADGTVLETETRLAPVLFYGFVKHYDEKGNIECLVDKRLMATLASAVANLRPIGKGEVVLMNLPKAEAALADMGVPDEPVSVRYGVEEAWADYWRKTGLLCEMSDGLWRIESMIPEEYKKYRVRHYVDGELVNYAGTTEYVELCDGRILPATALTEEDMNMIADPVESEVNSGKVDGKAAYEAYMASKR